MSEVFQLFRDAAFDPEAVQTLCTAYELAAKSLRDKHRPASVNEVIAKRIISLAEKGERDPRLLANAALKAAGFRGLD